MRAERVITAAVAVSAALAIAGCAVPVAGSPFPVVVAVPPATTPIAPPQTVYVQPPAPMSSSAETVIAYYDALNRRDFLAAWYLGGENLSGKNGYSAYVAGFAVTVWDTLTVTAVDGGAVGVRLSALQADGSVRTFTGSYTVSDGVIVGSHMTRMS